MDFFSPAQCAGYVAFVFGFSAFLQKRDTPLKALNAAECLAYTLHFALLGNPPAAACALISSARSVLAVTVRAKGIVWIVLAVIAATGFVVVRTPLGILPVIATCSATLAMFLMRGIPMRLALLLATALWLVNNIASGSIGGTLLESFIALANVSTMVRMLLDAAREKKKRSGPQMLGSGQPSASA
ncbi:hypothetical protein A33M_0230 [Rhodovulum sp. PH10]|uniref:YgjV family protein n=1 Tax=Rhodovulum sp. PH10 TaxID=1187851 RepID=UPI00027C23D1|nr:YgjV family protein [Rhodovulum sp. PH10]EJW10293.1 hypothetical protein A33M_0230 [Rhodovulum sp. PH10]